MDVILPARAGGDAGGVTPSGATGATPAADPNLKVNTDAPPATTPPGSANNPLTPLRNAVGATTAGQARKALLSLIDAAGDDVAKARENIENWFNSTMDRVAGMYKRRAQWMILFLGLGVSIALNADTIYIVRALSNDSTLRASLVAAAQEYAKQPPNADSKPDERLKENYNAIQGLGLPIGWSKVAGGDPALSLLKNRLDAPADGEAETWSLARIVKLNNSSPKGWSKKNSRDILEDLGEGTPVTVRGWLVNADVSALETCNCKVSGAENRDFHLNLTSTKPDAKKDPDEAKDEEMDRSVVVEMSPRSRRKDWVLTKLRALADVPTYVRVTGWLMFDSAHASFEHMPRASAWEVHPVTKFEVCVETKTKCDKGTGWKPLEEAQ